jgi:ABC-type glutathione transport system ATPase component
VGQHFRDCASAAEDLRELEELKACSLKCETKGTAPVDLDKHTSLAVAIAEEMQQFVDYNAINNALLASNRKDSVPCLQVKNLSFSYPVKANNSLKKSNNKKLLLRNISLSIPSGGYSVGLCGPSGLIYSIFVILAN